MKNKNLDLVYGDMQIIDKDSNYLYTHCYRKIFRKEFIYHLAALVGQPSAFWKRKIFIESNKFDTSYKLASDYDLFAKFIIDKKIHYKYIQFPFSSFRVHDEALSKRYKNINLNEVNNIRKRYKFSFIDLFISKTLNYIHKFNSLFKYSSSRILYLFNLRYSIFKRIINLLNINYLKLLSTLKYFYLSNKANIIFGSNSKIYISQGVKILDNVNINLEDNSTFFIGKNTIIDKDVSINVRSSTFIGSENFIKKGYEEEYFQLDSNKKYDQVLENIYIRNNSILGISYSSDE